MFKILIVDDERVEREGIKFLIEINHLYLDAVEAENGQNALKYIESNEVDILFTDIKMPFMDGLELAEKARKINPGIKIVIFSAFGEFDYARKAIENQVVEYILKPINIPEFLELMDKLICLLKEEEVQKQKEVKILKGYLNDQEYQKSKLLYDLINETETCPQFDQRFMDAGISFQGFIQLMLVNSKEKLFDTNNDGHEQLFKSLFDCKYEFLNINERQSLLFLHGFQDTPDRGYLESLGKSVRQCISTNFKKISYIFFGNAVCGIKDISKQYSSIEQALDYRFYYEGGAVLFTDSIMQNATWDIVDEKLLSAIYDSIDSKDFNYTIDIVEKLFTSFKQNACLSPVFVKYQCTNILKKLYGVSGSDFTNDITQQIKKLFEKYDLMDLKQLIQDRVVLEAQKDFDGSKDTVKHVVREVVEIITNEYMKDLSLEYIAQRVYMTPSYISYLFKKEMGTTPIKYITQLRLDKARNLLLHTNMKIVDIAESLGYSSVSYFCLLFRNKFGASPAGLREEGAAR